MKVPSSSQAVELGSIGSIAANLAVSVAHYGGLGLGLYVQTSTIVCRSTARRCSSEWASRAQVPGNGLPSLQVRGVVRGLDIAGSLEVVVRLTA
jgi:hypothetical protein